MISSSLVFSDQGERFWGNSDHCDQPKSQGSSKPSNMPPSTSIPPYEKLQVFTDKVYTISMSYEV